MIYYNLNGSEKKLKANDIFMITAGAEDIEINKNELAQRLGVSRGYSDDMIEKCRKRLMGLLSYKCAYINVPVSFRQENICDLEFMQVRSRNLYRVWNHPQIFSDLMRALTYNFYRSVHTIIFMCSSELVGGVVSPAVYVAFLCQCAAVVLPQ